MDPTFAVKHVIPRCYHATDLEGIQDGQNINMARAGMAFAFSDSEAGPLLKRIFIDDDVSIRDRVKKVKIGSQAGGSAVSETPTLSITGTETIQPVCTAAMDARLLAKARIVCLLISSL